MNDLFEMIKGKDVLLIGGAPRSGTTLMQNVLDAHPDCLAFPFEHSTLEQFYWNQGKDHFFLNEFITNRACGQQSIMASEALLSAHSEKLRAEFGKKFYEVEVDHSSFISGYHKYLDDYGVSMESVLKALMAGLVSSNAYARDKVNASKYLVFKQPFYTELFAQFAALHIDGVRYVHMSRDPFARYCSAKKRRLVLESRKGRRLTHINRVNFVLGHAQVDIVAHKLLFDNIASLGRKMYFHASYERLLEERYSFLSEISEFLSILPDPMYYSTPSCLGCPIEAGSTFVNKYGIDVGGSRRERQYCEITSFGERITHKYYLAKSGLLDVNMSSALFLFASMLPAKHSTLAHYLYQLLLSLKQVSFDPSLTCSDFIESAKLRRINISGAT